jgi:hypothetical protein
LSAREAESPTIWGQLKDDAGSVFHVFSKPDEETFHVSGTCKENSQQRYGKRDVMRFLL